MPFAMSTDRTFFPQEIIRRKRDGASLDDEEIRHFVRAMTDRSLSEGQIAAFAMAVFFRGMTAREAAALTDAMTVSGTVLDWSEAGLSGPVLDKHSTGGIGDKVSLMLAPIVAACGGIVPMISGRGLGHTGGTLDKLDSIPGYDTTPGLEGLRAAIRAAGCAIIGQTAELAPADGILYAVRDVTATVESIPLITASILSKKRAAGLDALVMDVKFGSGAFMRGEQEATKLAESLVRTAAAAGLPCTALLTDMNQALGRNAGNAVEVAEAMAFLSGDHRDERLAAVTLALAAELLVLGGLADAQPAGRAAASAALDSGAAAEHFSRMVVALGGPADLMQHPERHLAQASEVHSVPPTRSGVVAGVDARALGLAIMELGGGRRRADDTIDPAVGLTEIAGLGETVGADRPLALVHASNEDHAARAAASIRAAFTIEDGAHTDNPVVRRRIGTEDLAGE